MQPIMIKDYQPPRHWTPQNQPIFFLPVVVLVGMLFFVGGSQSVTVALDGLEFTAPGVWTSIPLTQAEFEAGGAVPDGVDNLILEEGAKLENAGSLAWFANGNVPGDILVFTGWYYDPLPDSGRPDNVRFYLGQRMIQEQYRNVDILQDTTDTVNNVTVRRVDRLITDEGSGQQYREIWLGVEGNGQQYFFVLLGGENAFLANDSAVATMVQSMTVVN